jgi:hypothetical protein
MEWMPHTMRDSAADDVTASCCGEFQAKYQSCNILGKNN